MQTGDLTITMDPASGPPSTTIGTQTSVLPFYRGFPVVSQLAFGTSDCASFSFVSATATGPASSAPDVNVPAAQTVANGTVLPFTFTPAIGDQFVLLNNIPTAQPALYQWFVNLGYGPSMTATVAVPAVHVAGVCGGNPPVASFNSDVVAGGSGTVGQPVQLDASQSSDADNVQLVLANGVASGCGLSQSLTYMWTIASAPAGSTATVSPSSGELNSFVPDVAGKYTIRLVVTDSTGLSSAPFVQDIIVANAPSP